jgi:hypothetical protein
VQSLQVTDRFGEFMPRERRELYERLIEQTPRLLARTSRGAGEASLLGALGPTLDLV